MRGHHQSKNNDPAVSVEGTLINPQRKSRCGTNYPSDMKDCDTIEKKN